MTLAERRHRQADAKGNIFPPRLEASQCEEVGGISWAGVGVCGMQAGMSEASLIIEKWYVLFCDLLIKYCPFVANGWFKMVNSYLEMVINIIFG